MGTLKFRNGGILYKVDLPPSGSRSGEGGHPFGRGSPACGVGCRPGSVRQGIQNSVFLESSVKIIRYQLVNVWHVFCLVGLEIGVI